MPPAAAAPDCWVFDCVEALLEVLPEVEPLALPLADGDVPLLVDGAAPPAALLLVVPDALPEPEDWLVCAPWFMVEDGLVVVALWLADTPALTSLLLMPEAEVLGWLGCAL